MCIVMYIKYTLECTCRAHLSYIGCTLKHASQKIESTFKNTLRCTLKCTLQVHKIDLCSVHCNVHLK